MTRNYTVALQCSHVATYSSAPQQQSISDTQHTNRVPPLFQPELMSTNRITAILLVIFYWTGDPSSDQSQVLNSESHRGGAFCVTNSSAHASV